jgi:hypothetical protein
MLAHFERNGNASRWCSIGNMFVAATAVPHSGREMVAYAQSADPNGGAMVTSAALAFLA